SAFDRFASLRNKAKIAQEKGALGIIFVNGIYPKNEDALPNPRYDGARAMNDFAVVQAKRDLISELLSDNGFDFEAIQKNIDLNKKPNSFLIENLSAQITTDLKEVEKIARNVGGMLEGNDPILKNEVVVVGGHYDHLGIDQLSESSMYKGTDKQIHNGADDNASGTAGVIEVAEKLAFMKDKIKRTYYFTAFSGEELGLLGSAYLTNNFPTDISNTAAMLNMDMIGRINEENNLTVIGAGTSSKWKDILNAKNSYDLKLAFSDGGSGGSDHQAFSNKNIPVLFFFTGTHTDYHKPSDDADKINYPGQEKVLNFVFDVALALDELTEKPDYVKVAEPTNRGMGRSRVSIGTVPEFGWNGEGYKLSGVTEGGSAAKAGLKSGDIIVKFGTKKVSNIYDFMYAVQDFKPGDTVDVVVLRDGKEETFSLELVAR
ncbi:MAG: M28 family peptidase, partial [Ignavibacteria bacterium]|nr:M28 family peptidase [Ignavibacteria bacterium]